MVPRPSRRTTRKAGLVGALASLTLAAALIPGLTSATAAPADPDSPEPALAGLDLSGVDVPALPDREAGVLADAELDETYETWEEQVADEGVGGASSDDVLQVEVLHRPGSEDAAAAVLAAGAESVEMVTKTLMVAVVPFDRLEAVEALDEVEYVRLPLELNAPPEPLPASEDEVGVQKGPRGSDILNKTKANAWHNAGVTGAGVKVGIIDYFHSSYWNGAKGAGEIDNDQPKGTFCRLNGKKCNIWTSNSPHGTAVAEVISDLAPDADLYLATVSTTKDTKDAIKYFRGKGVRVVSRSLGAFLDGPGNGTGPAAEVLKFAVSKNMAWFNSAGNHGVYQGLLGYQGGYVRGKVRDRDGDAWMEFKDPRGSDTTEGIYVQCGYFQGLRWNDWKRNRTDYDLYAFRVNGSGGVGKVITSSRNNQRKGAPPIEGSRLNSINCSKHPDYFVAVGRAHKGNGTGNDTVELMANAPIYTFVSNGHSATQPFVDTKSPGGAAVGAVDPVGGTSIAPYSSRGPTNDGRIKPNLSAGSNMASYSYGSFNGTSASTPVVAGAAALALQLDPQAKPAAVVEFLTKYGTVDRGKSGSDNDFGTGELVLGAFSSKPKVSGTAKKGSTLTAKPGKWGPTSSVSLSYQWYRNGTAISGATATTYTVVEADRGKKLTVRVTGSQPGFPTAARTSAAKKVA